MPKNGPAREPEDLPVLFDLPSLSIDSSGIPSGGLTVVTEDGCPLRIVSVRSTGYGQAEITVAEEAP